MKDLVLCDIDHCVADARWRDPMICPGGWDAYHAASIDDPPVEAMIRLLGAMQRDGIIIFGLTSRPEKWRALTIDWLQRQRCPMRDVLMRPSDDLRPSPQVKLDLARPYLARTLFVIDDRGDICDVFRSEGVIVIQWILP